MVNLELYRVFYTVAKCGSLTRAAEELYISQPAVSQSVKQLETQLGVTLFNRTHRGMELSEDGGKVIFFKVEKALQLFDEAKNEVRFRSAALKGTLKIGVSQDILRLFLREKLADFCSKFPSVKVELFLNFDGEDGVKQGKVDAAFITAEEKNDAALIYKKAYSYSEIFVSKKEQEETGTAQSFCGKPLVMKKQSLEALRKVGESLEAAVLTEDYETVKALCVSGAGTGVLPEALVEEELKSGELKQAKWSGTPPPFSVFVAYLKERQTSELLGAFLSAL